MVLLSKLLGRKASDPSVRVQTAKQASKVTQKEATDTEEEFKAGNAAMSTYKASQTAWKASQAAEAAAEAEQFAVEASQHARNARTAASLDHALAAAQSYNQARSPATPAAVIFASCRD